MTDDRAQWLIANAARAYVHARYELRGADASGMLAAIARVDDAWHELTIAIGEHDPECCGSECVDELDEGAHYASGRPIVTEREL